MATTHIDIVDGARGVYGPSEWEGVTRVATVSGVGGAASAKIETARVALGISPGDAHPSISSITVTRLVPRTISDSAVAFVIEYEGRGASGDPNTTDLRISTGMREGEWSFTADGLPMELAYVDSAGRRRIIKATASGRHYGMTITARRRESFSPISLSEYVGSVNSGAWSLDPSCKPREWRCSGIDGDSIDGGSTFDTTYIFEYRRNERTHTGDWVKYYTSAGSTPNPNVGWDTIIEYSDPETGQIPYDLDNADNWEDATGIARMYPTKDFNGLNL